MKWVLPKYSKNQVAKAGETLLKSDTTFDEYIDAMNILSNWRAVHAYPMYAILSLLRRNAPKLDKRAIVVQRLKRTPSITNKLYRYNKMKLDRMQDIGGCRAVVSSVSKVEKLAKKLMNSKTQHVLHKFNDYIKNPKESGYRSIHLVYKYNGEKEEYKNMFVEIQLRSRIQHAWATAVEIVDTFTRQSLKASYGEIDWLQFFKYISAEFSKLEKRNPGAHNFGIDTLEGSIKLATKLKVIQKLNSFAVTTDYIIDKKMKKSEYFLMQLDESINKIFVTQFSQFQLEEATDMYLDCEKRAKNEETYDVVLASASSINNLKSTYPNYFADSKDFIKYLSSVLEN